MKKECEWLGVRGFRTDHTKCANIVPVTGDSRLVRTSMGVRECNSGVHECVNLTLIVPFGLALAITFPLSNEAAEAGPSSPGVNQSTPQTNAAEIVESAYELRLRQTGKCNVGQTGRAEITLLAKFPYHVNQEYPLNFRLRASPGIKYPRADISKDFARLDPMHASIPIEFTPAHSGHAKIIGTLKFSVCNNQRCLVEKRDLDLDVIISEAK